MMQLTLLAYCSQASRIDSDPNFLIGIFKARKFAIRAKLSSWILEIQHALLFELFATFDHLLKCCIHLAHINLCLLQRNCTFQNFNMGRCKLHNSAFGGEV